MVELPVLEKFFFEASLKGYASGAKAVRSPDPLTPGRKIYTHTRRDPGLYYVDAFWTSGEGSGGTTFIYEMTTGSEDRWPLLWFMHYGGWCKGDNPAVLDVPKGRLRLAYERREFLGGRGVDGDVSVANQTLCYRNQWHGRFEYFGGEERIFVDRTPDTVFWHKFWGMAPLHYRLPS